MSYAICWSLVQGLAPARHHLLPQHPLQQSLRTPDLLFVVGGRVEFLHEVLAAFVPAHGFLDSQGYYFCELVVLVHVLVVVL